MEGAPPNRGRGREPSGPDLFTSVSAQTVSNAGASMIFTNSCIDYHWFAGIMLNTGGDSLCNLSLLAPYLFSLQSSQS